MSLTMHLHPLASFCWKPLIALYENGTPFTSVVVDLGNEQSRAAFLKLWPAGKMPVLRDEARDRTVPESTIVIEYLNAHYPGPVELVPADFGSRPRDRLADRFYDFYVQEPMQKIVGDRLRPEGQDDPFGVEQARVQLRSSYAMIDQDMHRRHGRRAKPSPWPIAPPRRHCSTPTRSSRSATNIPRRGATMTGCCSALPSPG